MFSSSRKNRKLPFSFSALAICILCVFASSRCSNNQNFSASSVTQYFTQGYNPQYIDVLWVVDVRSPMANAATLVTNEATTLFSRLDSVLGTYGQYRMGIISVDAQLQDAALLPLGSGQILQRSDGTLAQRTSYFNSIFAKVLNLNVGAQSLGLQASIAALDPNQVGSFTSNPLVPLVLIYFSYDDEYSTPKTQSGAQDVNSVLSYYQSQLLALKNGNANLLRVYAADYVALTAGQTVNAQDRCAREYDNPIDISPSTFQNRYMNFATLMGGSTADLCQAGFSSTFDLNGLTLTTLPNTFLLQSTPAASSIQVNLTNNGQAVSGYPWTYNSTANQIVFSTTPPQGVTIQVTYLPN